MKLLNALVLLLLALPVARAESLPNPLTDEEKSDGWQLLFDGNSTDGWRGFHREDVPKCWQVIDGELAVNAAGVTDDQGDLITEQQFGDFELCWEWKMPDADGNSGVKYYVLEELASDGAGIGLEYQLMYESDGGDPDYHGLASLYEIYAAIGVTARPLGEWNSSRIISAHNHVEHWLNGVKVLEYQRGSDDFRQRVAESKFAQIPNFGEAVEGHLLLQQHGSPAFFRSIKIRRL
jgi:hypothetical protein